MEMYKKNVTVDMSAENNYNCVTVKEGDYKSRYLNVVILADGAKFVFQDGDIVSLRCLHENDTFDITFGTFKDDLSVLIEIPKTIISQHGTATCDIAITRGSDSLLSSSCITLEIVKSPVGKKIDTDEGPASPSELWAIIQSSVQSNTTFRQKLEDNTDTLDKLTTSKSGKLLFDGKEIEGVGGGIYIGSGEMPEGFNVQIDPEGDAVVIPTKTSELINDSGFITRKDLPEGGSGSGVDGFSPVVNVTEIEGGHRVSITDAENTKTFDVLDGKKGDKGDKGDPYILTESDKNIIVEAVKEALPKYNGEVIEA